MRLLLLASWIAHLDSGTAAGMYVDHREGPDQVAIDPNSTSCLTRFHCMMWPAPAQGEWCKTSETDQKKILGVWLYDLQSSLTSKPTFLGTDISQHRFPTNPPDNMTFQLQDILDPCPSRFQTSFDLVHQRLVLAGSGPSAHSAVTHLAELVRPGGWVQLVEADFDVETENEPAMQGFFALLKCHMRAMGTDTTFAKQMRGWIREALTDLGLSWLSEGAVVL